MELSDGLRNECPSLLSALNTYATKGPQGTQYFDVRNSLDPSLYRSAWAVIYLTRTGEHLDPALKDELTSFFRGVLGKAPTDLTAVSEPPLQAYDLAARALDALETTPDPTLPDLSTLQHGAGYALSPTDEPSDFGTYLASGLTSDLPAEVSADIAAKLSALSPSATVQEATDSVTVMLTALNVLGADTVRSRAPWLRDSTRAWLADVISSGSDVVQISLASDFQTILRALDAQVEVPQSWQHDVNSTIANLSSSVTGIDPQLLVVADRAGVDTSPIQMSGSDIPGLGPNGWTGDILKPSVESTFAAMQVVQQCEGRDSQRMNDLRASVPRIISEVPADEWTPRRLYMASVLQGLDALPELAVQDLRSRVETVASRSEPFSAPDALYLAQAAQNLSLDLPTPPAGNAESTIPIAKPLATMMAGGSEFDSSAFSTDDGRYSSWQGAAADLYATASATCAEGVAAQDRRELIASFQVAPGYFALAEKSASTISTLALGALGLADTPDCLGTLAQY
ncbi:hypothetical protein [Microbacterium enclense]|uniref:hypothetical protein n=1 Tax=Microbacterium enclense TaxID=993073 RepID=UPI003427D000